MFCSTVIPTIGRPTLHRAVCSILEQQFTAADLEIIVVNDSGGPLPKEEWQQDDRVQIVDTHQRERSVARNTGAALANGQYLHFLDDDDWMLPDAFENFWQLTRVAPHAAWVYGGCQLVDRQEKPLIELHPVIQGNGFVQVMAGEWIPPLASLISAKAYFATGGFHPNIVAGEDVDLCRRIALDGDFEKMSAVVACAVMGVDGSSTNHVNAKKDNRLGREGILQMPGVFRRMRASANASCWYGRMVRIYLTSALWNIKHKRPSIAASRTFMGLVSFALGGTHLLSPDYWHAIMYAYQSESFARGFRTAELQVLEATQQT